MRRASLPPPHPARRRNKARPVLQVAAAGTLAALLSAWTAAAQESTALRGPIPGSATAGAAPVATDSTGGISSDDGDAARAETAAPNDNSLFEDPIDLRDANDPFVDPKPAPMRAPSTRRDRQKATREGLTRGPATARAATVNGEAETEDTAANARTKRVLNEAERLADDKEAGRAERALPIEALPRTDRTEADPFAPVGLRAGTFILRPSVEQGITASSNSARVPDGSSGVLSETIFRLNAQSDWTENSAVANAYGTFRKSLSGDAVEDVEGGADATLLFDLSREWKGRTALSYSVRPESPSSPDLVADAAEQPLRQVLRAEAGLDKALGLLRLGGTVSVERGWYGDAELSNGETLDQSERDSTLALVKLRTGYELSPAVIPFVEVEGGRRFYDDSGDTDRSALRLGARGGLALDLREKLSGEISAGYLREEFDDDDLDPIQGLNLNAALEWSPVRGTAVGLNASTSVEGTTTEGESGSILYDLRLDVERRLSANLTGEAAFGASFRDYSGSDDRDLTLLGELGTTWWLNRNLGLSGRLRHERLESSLDGRDYQENSVFFGTKLQY